MGRRDIEQILENAFLENKKLSAQTKSIIVDYVNDFNEFFSSHNVEIDFDNLSSNISTLDFREVNNISSAVEYDSQSNSFLFPKDSYSSLEDIERLFQKAILSLVTNVYSIETDRHNEGLNFEMNGKKYGKIVNEKVKDRVIELIYGNPESKIVTLPTTTDSLCMDFESMIGSENLLTYFVNGRGDLMFSSISELFTNNEDCIEFFDNLNRYSEVDENDMRELRKIDRKYEEKRDEILKNKYDMGLAI